MLNNEEDQKQAELEQILKEHGLEADEEQKISPAIEIDFLNYIASLGYQAMIFLGEVPNPVTQQIEKNLKQAKLLIDTLTMLQDKTQGNLTEQEESLLTASVSELQDKYVEAILPVNLGE